MNGGIELLETKVQRRRMIRRCLCRQNPSCFRHAAYDHHHHDYATETTARPIIQRNSRSVFRIILLLLLCRFGTLPFAASTSSTKSKQQQQQRPSSSKSSSSSNRRKSTHTNNWAVILSSSRYWFNYRHHMNAILIYQLLLEQGGFDDDHIIFMLADEYAVNARNPRKNELLAKNGKNVYYNNDNDNTMEIDYRGEDVTAEELVKVLTGHGKGQKNNHKKPVLQSDQDSNVLIYWTGHGGDQFFKFQDVEEIMAVDIAAVFRQMHLNGMYREILFVSDTCQAFTLGDKITAPNVTIIGSSLKGESSYAYGNNNELGLALVERYTHALVERLQENGGAALRKETIRQGMIDPFSFQYLSAHVAVKDDLAVRKAGEARIADFFVNVQRTRASSTGSKQQQEQKQQGGELKILDDCAKAGNDFPSMSRQRRQDQPPSLPPRKEDNGSVQDQFDSTSKKHDPDLENVWRVEPGSIPFLSMVSASVLLIYGLSLLA